VLTDVFSDADADKSQE